MRRPPRFLALAATTCLAGLLAFALAPAPVARADAWSDARSAFRKAMREESWETRRDAIFALAAFDAAPTVEELLDALEDEPSAAVVLQGVEVLSAFVSLDAREALLEVARKGRGRPRLIVLLALDGAEGPDVAPALLEVARDRDEPAAAQALLALRAHPGPKALEVALDRLGHKDWQVVRAAAMALAAWKDATALPALARAFAEADGRARTDLLAALRATTGEDLGWDPKAWRKLADGEDVASIEPEGELPPSAFGVPIAGERVVIVLDESLRMGDPHPFDRDRLMDLSSPPDGNPIPWFRTATNGQFAHGQVKHLIDGLPRGTSFELITFNATVQRLFERLMPANAGTRLKAVEHLEAVQTDDGIATWPALEAALDIAGEGDAKAWRKGPDEILFVTVNMPTAGEVTDATAVAAAIGLKARLRMVPIHTVGIHYHPYEMCRAIAERTGGTYVNLVE